VAEVGEHVARDQSTALVISVGAVRLKHAEALPDLRTALTVCQAMSIVFPALISVGYPSSPSLMIK